MGCTNQNTYVCSHGVKLPSKTNGRPKTRFTGAFEALIRLSNESGTSERSSKESETIRGSVGVVVHLRDALQIAKTVERTEKSERARRGRGESDCVLPLKDKLELQSSRRKLVKSIR
jgi:hypothetical protein